MLQHTAVLQGSYLKECFQKCRYILFVYLPLLIAQAFCSSFMIVLIKCFYDVQPLLSSFGDSSLTMWVEFYLSALNIQRKNITWITLIIQSCGLSELVEFWVHHRNQNHVFKKKRKKSSSNGMYGSHEFFCSLLVLMKIKCKTRFLFINYTWYYGCSDSSEYHL